MKTPPPSDLAYAEHASDILSKAAGLVEAAEPLALITSLGIEGGAAREVGSLALVDGAGEMTGYLSNGCIDRDIQLHAVEALQSRRKKLIRYGDGSRYADLKLPCGGALTVLIDPTPNRQEIVHAAAQFAARKPVTMMFHGQDESRSEISRTFRYTPRHRLVLAGRGAIFRSMAQISNAMGYEVHLLSPDTADIDALAHLANATPRHLTSPDTVRELDMLDEYSAFLTLFHDHDWEPWLLRAALETPAHFIGSLGSRRTHDMRCETLRQMGVPEASLERLRGPIGLVSSLRDASSISVSAMAEIVGSFQRTDGQETSASNQVASPEISRQDQNIEGANWSMHFAWPERVRCR